MYIVKQSSRHTHTWCCASSRLPPAHRDRPRRCRILASSSLRPNCSARRRPADQRGDQTLVPACLSERHLFDSHDNCCCVNPTRAEPRALPFFISHCSSHPLLPLSFHSTSQIQRSFLSSLVCLRYVSSPLLCRCRQSCWVVISSH